MIDRLKAWICETAKRARVVSLWMPDRLSAWICETAKRVRMLSLWMPGRFGGRCQVVGGWMGARVFKTRNLLPGNWFRCRCGTKSVFCEGKGTCLGSSVFEPLL